MKLIKYGITLTSITYVRALTALSVKIPLIVKKTSAMGMTEFGTGAEIIGYNELSEEQRTRLISSMIIIAKNTFMSVNDVAIAINSLVMATERAKEKCGAFSDATASMQKEEHFIKQHKPCTGNDFINKKINKRKPKWQS